MCTGINAALREAELGNIALARNGVDAALALSQGKDVKIAAALTLARIGDPRAGRFARQLARDYPLNTMLKFYWLPTINAAIELRRHHPSNAVAQLQAAAPYELGVAGMFINYLYPVYIRGQAFLTAGNGIEAAAEFQKVLDHSGIVVNFVIGALSQLQIGRSYAMSGDDAKAKAAYQKFFALWKDADPDISVLQEARVDYAKLR